MTELDKTGNFWWLDELVNALDTQGDKLEVQTAENIALKSLVREMIPHLRYLKNIPDTDTVSWAPGKLTKKSINKILNRPEVKAIMEER